MKPWLTLDIAHTADGTPLMLQQRGAEFSIRLGGQVLMTSRSHGSEEMLATATLEQCRAKHVLIGGLGMGYTVRAALDRMGPDGRVVVAELMPAVVSWNQGPLAHLARRPLADPRVTVAVGDVRAPLAREAFDAILLDVDNGPGAISEPSSAGLYSARGLATFREALRPGGRLGLWAAAPVPQFLERLRKAQLPAEMRRAGGRHVIFVATRSRGPGVPVHPPRVTRRP